MVGPHAAEVADAGVVPADLDFPLEGALEDVVDALRVGPLPRLHDGFDLRHLEDRAAARARRPRHHVLDRQVAERLGRAAGRAYRRQSDAQLPEGEV